MQKFNVGADAVLQIVTSAGGLLKPTLLTEFSFKQETVDLKSRPINGRVIHRVIPDGWSGNFTFDRADNKLDDYFAQREEDYYAGLAEADVYIVQTIREIGGGQSQYRFGEVAMKYEDGGAWKQDDKVSPKVSWMASSRRKVL